MTGIVFFYIACACAGIGLAMLYAAYGVPALVVVWEKVEKFIKERYFL